MTMARDINDELNHLKSEVASLRGAVSRLRQEAEPGLLKKAESAKDEIVGMASAIKDRISSEVGDVSRCMTGDIDALKSSVDAYAEKAQTTLRSHPLAVVAGAIVVGFVLGRFQR